MSMNGIDVSSNQPADICRLVDYGFAVVKATGNPPGYAWDYVNPYMRQQVDDALNKTGCAGLYHFTYGRDANEEADHFTKTVKDYIGRAVLVIDYEGKAIDNGREWLRTLIRRVKANTGVNPMVYASSSVIGSQSLVNLCKEEDCGIWSANYYAGYKQIDGYSTEGLRMDIPQSAMWQYTSTGRLNGYGGNLDLDIFYGDKDAWLAYAKGSGEAQVPKPSIDEIAAQVWEGLWGDGQDRIDRLTAAGYDPNEVQKRVNETAPSTDRIYTVVKGDTLSDIGQHLGVNWQTIARRNGISSPYTIYPGQTLRY